MLESVVDQENIQKLEIIKKIFDSLEERFIFEGDHNAKNIQWETNLTITKGEELLKAINTMAAIYEAHSYSEGPLSLKN